MRLRIYCWLLITLPILGFPQQPAPAFVEVAYSQESFDFVSLFSAFEKESGIQVRTTRLLSGDMKTELLTRADTGNLPDMVIVPADFIGLPQVDYSDVPPDWLNNAISQQTNQLAQWQNTQYGIPIIAGNHLLLYYNKSLVSEAAQSWQQLRAQQELLAAQDIELIGWAFNEMYWFQPFIAAFGGQLFDSGKITLDSMAMQQALQFYTTLNQQKLVNQACTYACNSRKFLQGEMAYMINGSWAFGELRQSLGNNLGVSLLPTINGQPMKPYFSVHVLAFPDRSLQGQKAPLLKKLATFMQSETAQLQLWNNSYALPTHSELFNHIKRSPSPQIQGLLQQLEQAQPLPNDPAMAIVWEALLQGFNRYHAGVLNASEASEYMQYIATQSRQKVE